VARSSSNTIVKFADDTVVVLGLISGNDEKAYPEEANMSLWCQDISLMLNVSKTNLCLFCGGIETLFHCFIECARLDSLFTFSAQVFA